MSAASRESFLYACVSCKNMRRASVISQEAVRYIEVGREEDNVKFGSKGVGSTEAPKKYRSNVNLSECKMIKRKSFFDQND